MKLGVHLANGRSWSSAEAIVALGLKAEAWGYDSVWTSDHVVIPSKIDEAKYPYGPPGTFNPDAMQNYYEAYGVLAYMAGATKRVKLGTSVVVVPQRQPVLVAKQWATLDALSGGRTILGVGAGWMQEEFAALGTGELFGPRGAATDEAIKLYRALWTQEGDVTFAGQVYSLGPVRAYPKPVQPGGPPIWVGGHGRRSVRRAAELGDGWHAVRISLDGLRDCLTMLNGYLERYQRQPGQVQTSTVVALWAPGQAPAGSAQDSDLCGSAEQVAERVRAYAALGLDHFVVSPQANASAALALEALDFFTRDVRPLLGLD